MKFGKHLARQQLDIPEYAAHFVNYKALKKLIKSLAAASRATSTSAQASTAGSTSSERVLNDPQVTLQANKATFFFRLERELEKVNAFYLQKEAELKLRLRTLVDKKSLIQSRTEAASKISAVYLTLQEGFQQFQLDLNKLQQFVELNATAFSKILKKWDKSSKSRTKELYLSRAVEVQPCFNRDVIAELSDQAATSLLELEGWAEGENITFDQKPDRHLNDSDNGNADEDFLKVVFAENTTVLKEWINRLQNSPSARDRISRVFLAAIPEASNESLAILVETDLINFQAQDEISERTCLHEAAIAGKSYIMKLGLEHGLDASRTDVYGRIPLHYASMHGHLDMIRTLVEVGPSTINNMDHDNFTPLLHAIAHNQPLCVKELIASGARIDANGEQGYIPLNLACQHGFVEVTEIILSQRPQIMPDAEGLYPQHLIARAGHSGKLFLTLKEYGVDLNEPDRLNQWTAVFHAASEGHVECLKALLDLGAKPDSIDEKRLSAMYYAAWEGHLGCMELLSAAGGGLGIAVIKLQRTSPSSAQSGCQITVDSDGIPDLSLPPPIIPLRKYGHNFLDKKTLVQLTFEDRGSPPISFFDESKYPAARLTISSKSTDIVPRNVILPLTDDNGTISFQVNELEMFLIDFDIFPAFGAKILARTVALPNTFAVKDIGRRTLPLFDPRLRAIGTLCFEYQIIKPYPGIPLEITHFATYWKATSQFDSHTTALITGSSLSGEYVRLHVQLTSDCVPVIHQHWSINVAELDIPISSITVSQFTDIGLGFGSKDIRPKLTAIKSHKDAYPLLANAFMTLEDALDLLPHHIHIDLNIHYPNPSDYFALTKHDSNSGVDSVLNTVFDHARTLRQLPSGASRAVIFSSYNTNVCTALNWKQPNYPVFYCNDLGVGRKSFRSSSAQTSKSSTSIKGAVQFASSNNLMGIMCSAKLLDMVPALKQSVKEAGLVLVAEVSDSTQETTLTGVDGILRPEGVLTFEETIDVL